MLHLPPHAKVAYQGIQGAYSEEAASHLYPATTLVPHQSFADVFDAVKNQIVAAGVIPIENSLGGSILENYDLLLTHNLTVIGELSLHIRHFLLARPDQTLDGIRECISHPQALSQCAPWLQSHQINPLPAQNTAVAALEISQSKLPGRAAIASERAGKIYGLQPLACNIQTRADNTTRFFVIAKSPPSDLLCQKASIIFSANNKPGGLLKCLEVFSDLALNLSKIESRPTQNMPWEYNFYADFEGNNNVLEKECVDMALQLLKEKSSNVRLLGAYPTY